MPIIDPRDIDPHLRRKNAEIAAQIEEDRQYLESVGFFSQPGTVPLSTPDSKPRIRQLPPRAVTPAKTEAAADTLTELFARLRRNEAEHDSLLQQIAQAKGERA